MENNKLTAIILEPAKSYFNEYYRTLSIGEDQSFVIGIKEYEEEIKSLEDKLKILQKEKEKIDLDSNIERDKLFQQATDRYNQGGKWTKAETYQGKKVSHAEVTYNENLKAAEKKAEALKAKKDKELKKVQDELKDLEKKYDDIFWVWELAKKRSHVPTGANESIIKGKKRLRLQLNRHLHGGGFVWIEPFHENTRPTGSAKNGIYAHTEGGIPDIITAEWYGKNSSQIPVKITQPVAPMTQVQLHIYTKSLYGVDFRVELKANGKTLKANEYMTGFTVYANKKGEKTKDPEVKTQIEGSKDMFYTEADIYDYSAPSSVQPPAGAMTGHLVGGLDENVSRIPNVQKAVLSLYIDPAWCGLGEKKIIIKPTFHFSGKTKALEIPLEVNCSLKPNIEMPVPGNKAVFVDNIETSMQAFHPCGYNFFKVSDGDREIDLLEDKSTSPIDIFELVAGTSNNTHDITITLDTDTTECSYDGSPNDHEGHVIEISEYPEKKTEENAKEKEKSSISGSSKVKAQIGDKKNHVAVNEKLSFEGKLEIYTKTDKELKFKSRFIYDLSPYTLAGIQVDPIFRYFWLGNGVPTNTYLVKTHTCRYQQNLSIKTYPDVAWSLKLSYKNSTVERELWGNQRYADTDKAKFKRKPQKWIPAGDGKSIGISLGAKWDKSNEYDATADITKQVQKLLDSLGVIGKFVNSVFLGEENKKQEGYGKPKPENEQALESVRDKEKKELEKTQQNLDAARARYRNAQTDREREKITKDINSLQRKVDKQSEAYKLKLTRSIAKIEIQWPQLDAQFEWSLENIKTHGPYYNQTGVILQGALELTPLIGLTATLDFLALAQRVHPVAMALIAAADITMALIGDGSQITCNLTAAGTFGGKVQGFLNTKTKENSFNREDRNAKDKQVAELKCDLEFKLEISVKIKFEKKKLWVKVTVTGEAGANATAKWTGRAPIDADDYGWYIAPEMTFEGLEVKGYANVEGQIGDKDDTWGSAKSNNEINWQAIDAWKEPKQWGKFYFPSKKE
ncbi:hypothetical protein [Elizabethkingia anophelis]|uniref:hypothetical protein n=1 Tax=Elizabethkingia anophelis TaxID=1117645 RepID=UPI000B34D195|nr:hypothetical protein [Elizabethkingia anophelis]